MAAPPLGGGSGPLAPALARRKDFSHLVQFWSLFELPGDSRSVAAGAWGRWGGSTSELCVAAFKSQWELCFCQGLAAAELETHPGWLHCGVKKDLPKIEKLVSVGPNHKVELAPQC